MSGIFGGVRFGGGFDPAAARSMGQAMSYWGAAGGLHVDGGVAMGALLRFDEPASDDGVLALADGGVLVATARLDNRDDLRARFGFTPEIDDRRLVGAAWEHWGERACEQLFGDWSFAMWNPRDRRLVLARDHFGNTALYYYRGPRLFAFGSSRKALLALPEVPRRLNELRLAQHLAFWVTDGGATLHDGILRLPPGHQIIVTGRSCELARYWHPEQLPSLRLRDDRDYVEAFLEHYERAVRARVRTSRPVATTLSAGLDSGSVTALAARALGPREQPPIAFTSTPLFPAIEQKLPGTLVDEWPLAALVAKRAGITDHRRVQAAGVTTLGAFERSLFLHDEPEYGAGNLHWIIALLEDASAAGAGVLLSGQLGNGGVSWSGDQQRPIRSLREGRPLDAWHALRDRQRGRGASLPRTLWTEIIQPARVRARAFAFRREWSDAALSHNLMARDFAARSRIAERIRAARYDPLQSALLSPREQQLRVLLPEINPVGAFWHEAGAGYGLEILDPTADVRLLEFVLSIPDEQFAGGGEDRWLMRRGMEGILPPEVRSNVRRGKQAADLHLRLRGERQALDDAVARLAASPIVREYLDTTALTRTWRTTRDADHANAVRAAPIFARMLLWAMFLDGGDLHGGVAQAA